MPSDSDCLGCNNHTFPRAMHLKASEVEAMNNLLDSVEVRPYQPRSEAPAIGEAQAEPADSFELPSEATNEGFIIHPTTPSEQPSAQLEAPQPPEVELPHMVAPALPEEEQPHVEVPPAPAIHFMNESPSVEGNSVGLLATTMASGDIAGWLKDQAKLTVRTCQQRYKDCERKARVDNLDGIITDEELKQRLEACKRDRDHCQRIAGAFWLFSQQSALYEKWRRRAAEIWGRHSSCMQRAQQIADVAARASAIEACQHSLHESALHAAFVTIFDDIEGFQNIVQRLSPKRTLDCPCCVGSKDDITVHISGPVVGVDSHEEYAPESDAYPYPTEFNDYKENGFRSVDIPGIGPMWGFGIEISVPYTPRDCPCTCRFTQFASPPKHVPEYGGRPIDDVTKWPVVRYDNAEAEQRARDVWELHCEDGRLYFGDFIQQGVREIVDVENPPFGSFRRALLGVGGDFLFRTIFFSSGANCDRKWCSIDWMVSVEEKRNVQGEVVGYDFLGFKELARDEG